MSISFGGLVSGLNTDSIIQQMLSIESRPISLLLRQKATLQSQVSAFKDLNTKLAALEDKAFALTQLSNIVGRTATSADKNKLLATASSDAAVGSFNVEILSLASSTTLKSNPNDTNLQPNIQGNGFGGIAAQSLAGGDTLSVINSENKVQGQVSEGSFFVNGQQVTVVNSDTLTDVFTKINTATAGAVTGTLVNDAGGDTNKGGQRVSLTSGSNITLTAGTSNFLSLFKLDTSAAGATRTSSDDVNGVSTSLVIDDANNNFSQAAGSGTLTINGVGITYNGATDTINDIVARINASEAGVSASFSSAQGGQFTLTNEANGPLSINISDSGNLSDLLGLGNTDGVGGNDGIETLGSSAQIKINGGATQSFNKNTGIQPAGLTGVTLDLLDETPPASTINVTVSPDTDTVVGKVKDFVNQFNSIIDKIDDLTKFDQETGEKGILISDFTVSNVKDRLFRLAFSTVSGLSEGNNVGTLTELGISTGAPGSDPTAPKRLELDETKLRNAVSNSPVRVAQILGAQETEDSSQGIQVRLKNFLDGMSNSTGVFSEKQKIGKDRISDIDKRINTLNDRLVARQAFLENQFSRMESSLIDLQSQQSALSGLIGSIGR